jgi:hypothetical protein
MKTSAMSVKITLWISNLLFLLLYLLLAFHNRIAVDDFHFLANVQEFGVINATFVEYEAWSTRWLSVFVTHLVLNFHDYNYFLTVYHLFVLTVLFISIFYLLRNITSLLNFHLKKLELLAVALFISNASFFSSIRIDETWFWICATNTYVLSMAALFFGLAGITDKKTALRSDALVFFSFFYIGGSCESLAVFIVPLLILFLIYHKLYLAASLPAFIQRRGKIAIVSCLISFAILYSGEGIKIRQTFFQEISIFQGFLLNFKMSGIIFLRYFPRLIPFLILFTLPALFLGQRDKALLTGKKLFKKLFLTALVFVGLVLLFQFPITYKTLDVGAYRALFPLTFLALLGFGLLFYFTGKHLRFNFPGWALPLTFLIVATMNFSFLINQYPIVREYSAAYDQRIAEIKTSLTEKEINLKPLPPSGLLLSAEIPNDSSHFTRQHFKRAFRLTQHLNIEYQTAE